MTGDLTREENETDALSFPVHVTLEDQLALQMQCLHTPVMRAGRFRNEALLVAFSPIFGLLSGSIGVLIGWAGESPRHPLGADLRQMVREDLSLLMAVCIGMVLFTVAWIALSRRLIRPRMRRILRRVLRTRPDVNPADPELTFEARVTIDNDGIQSRTAMGSTQLSWASLKRWCEMDGRLFALGDAMTGICLNTSGVDPEQARRMRTILTARLGPKAH